MIKRKIFSAAAMAWFAAGAHAQSSVTLYGSIDEGVTYNTNAKGSGTALAGPVAVPDFFGLRGSEDLGNHLKAVFVDSVNYDDRLRDNYDVRSTGVIVAVSWL